MNKQMILLLDDSFTIVDDSTHQREAKRQRETKKYESIKQSYFPYSIFLFLILFYNYLIALSTYFPSSSSP
jgi:hypothetical protein